MKKMLVICLGLALLLPLGGVALADVSPPGAWFCNLQVTLSRHPQKAMLKGEAVQYEVRVLNVAAPGACDVKDFRATLTLPAADGTATGPVDTIAIGDELLLGDSQNYKRTYHLNLNDGVTKATARVDWSCIARDVDGWDDPVTGSCALTLSVK